MGASRGSATALTVPTGSVLTAWRAAAGAMRSTSILVALFVALAVRPARGQVTAAASPGSAGNLVLLDFAQAPLGGVPAGLRVLNGALDVVDHDGQRMLRATTRAMFIVSLPLVLPADFDIEMDLVPKECCQPEDVAIEGTLAINQGPASANILWKREAIMVVGGGSGFDRPMPDDLAAATPGVLTNIVFTFRGDELTIFTNGRLIYTLPNRKFVRGRVLRVFLGGQNDSDQAVYLARLRVSAGAGGANVTANVPTNPGVTAGPGTPGRSGPLAAGQSAGSGSAAGARGRGASQGPPPANSPATPGPASGPTGPGTPSAAIAPRTVGLPGFAGAGVFGAIPPRSIALPGFTAAGVSTGAGAAPDASTTLSPRIIAVPGFAAAGVIGAIAARTIALTGFSASGVFGALAPRTISLGGFSATGVLGVLPGRAIAVGGFNAVGVFGSIVPRTVALTGFTATGTYGSLVARTIAVPGFSGAGLFAALPPRTVDLAGFSATGGFLVLAPRVVSLAGFSATGASVTLPPRTIALPGWTAAGVIKNP